MVDLAQIPQGVRRVCARLEECGYPSWVVGGALRDLVLEYEPGDWDIATKARPEEVIASFRRVIPTGINHATVTVLDGKTGYEVTTLRGESGYSDGRRPDEVYFVDHIEEDLRRRDFTVNALAYRPASGEFCDPFGGLEDAKSRTLRAVGEPLARFREDGLRVLRAARFAAVLEFTIEKETLESIRPALDIFCKVSRERVHDEWVRLMRARQPSRGFRIMRDTGILDLTNRDLASLGDHDFDMAIRAVDTCPPTLVLRLCALFSTLDTVDRPARVRSWLKEYRFSKREGELVAHYLKELPLRAESHQDEGVLRRLLSRIGREPADDFFCLLSSLPSTASGIEDAALDGLRDRARSILDRGDPLTLRELALSGGELQSRLRARGVKRNPGPWIGEVQRALLELVLDAPEANTDARLLEEAESLLASDG